MIENKKIWHRNKPNRLSTLYSRFLEAYPTASFYPWFCDNIFQSLHILLLFVALDGYADGENGLLNSAIFHHNVSSNHILLFVILGNECLLQLPHFLQNI